MNDTYRKAGFDADQIERVCKLLDKVGNHFGVIPCDFAEQMYMDAEYITEDAYQKNDGPKDHKDCSCIQSDV